MIDLRRPELGRVLVVGHRGAEALAPENTWSSLQRGYEAGADMLEVDVQITRDGRPILYHDFTLQPKLGDPRWIRDLTWHELRALDVGTWFGPSFGGERVPLFSDVLAWARGRVALWVDLKHGFLNSHESSLEMSALDLIEKADMTDHVVISSWDQVALERVCARNPETLLAVNMRQRVREPVEQIGLAAARWVVVYWPQTDEQVVECLQADG